jgi:hypothetical protein
MNGGARAQERNRMGHNSGRSAVPGPVVTRLVATAAARLAHRHPSVDEAAVYAVVYQAAGELVSTIGDADQLRHMLSRRAAARLMAQTGAPIPLTPARQ